MAPRVLISDALSPAAVAIFKNRGLDVEFQPNLGKDKDKLAATINGFDGLAIRSATKVTGKLLEHAKGLKVIGRAGIGVDNVDIAAATARGIIVMHTPLTEKTRNIVNAETLAQMKRGVRLINCARGELVDEAALAEAVKSGQVAGAALDVFREEPATQSVLFGLPNVVCTPHLGASTMEAQENVALQVAEQMSDYLLRGAISNAVNFPSISAEEAPKLKPFIALAEKLGSFAGPLTESGVKQMRITYQGGVAEMNTKALTSAAVAGLLRPM